MSNNIPKKFLDLDNNFDGKYTSEKNIIPDLDMNSIILYCRENNINPEKLTDKEIKKFCFAKSL